MFKFRTFEANISWRLKVTSPQVNLSRAGADPAGSQRHTVTVNIQEVRERGMLGYKMATKQSHDTLTLNVFGLWGEGAKHHQQELENDELWRACTNK